MRVALDVHGTRNYQAIGIQMRPLETPIGFLGPLVTQTNHLLHLAVLGALLASQTGGIGVSQIVVIGDVTSLGSGPGHS